MGFSASCSGFIKTPLYFHRVQEGQSLGDIAADYGVDVHALQSLNPEVSEASESHSVPIISASIVVVLLLSQNVNNLLFRNVKKHQRDFLIY